MSAAGKPVAMVSGGSRGIGAAVVRALSADGFAVSFGYRGAEEAAAELAAETGGLAVRADVTDPEAVGAWLERTKSELGSVRALVTSAGITRDRPVALMSAAEWGDVLRTDLDGVFTVCQPVVFDMIKRKAGSVVTLSSVSGVYGNPTQANYSAAKSGVIGFTKALAKEVGRYGVRANVVAPGLIETDMLAEMAEPAREKLRASVPMRRFGTAEEVADLVSFLVSDKAGYINGSVLEITGGLTV
ncbi:3-oxoacyl-ACP reductase FabG [Sciscionella sediminilitoris]|uniref:3-oxoacyl-ACP reductase FabG n=1 Tax=Sciscionella sediminilitoris TaxID=1445613 RepID=UPI0004DF6CDA|nr:3-oxoacyl-ACP reductase FabG [Sciscionella sp. SE31]